MHHKMAAPAHPAAEATPEAAAAYHYHTHAIEVAPRPVIDEAGAASLAEALFGAKGPVSELGSHQDRNFRIDAADGPRVLKIANRSWPRAALEGQDAALEHIAAAGAEAGFDAPVPVRSLDGSLIRETRVGEETLMVRMLTFLEGRPLSGDGYIAPCVVADLGRLAGRAAALLAGLKHPGLDRPGGQWDLRRAADVVKALLPSIGDEARRARVAVVTEAAAARVAAVAPRLRVQPIHGDVTDDNVVARHDEAGRLRPHGIIDFGDCCASWRVAELAITASSVLRHRSDDAMSVLPAVAAFHAACPLDEADVEALWPLITLRGAVLVASGEHQSRLDPDNASATGPLASEWRIFDVASAMPPEVAEAAFRAALGLPPSPRLAAAAAAAAAAPAAPLLLSLAAAVASAAAAGAARAAPADPWAEVDADAKNVGFTVQRGVAVADLSTLSTALHSGDHLRGAAAEVQLLQGAASKAPARAAATRWREARFTRSVLNSFAAPATVALGVDVALASGSPLAAPWPLRIVSAAEASASTPASAGSASSALVVEGPEGVTMTMRGADLAAGLAVGSTVAAGAPLGSVSGSGLLHVRLCLLPQLAASAPEFAVPGPAADGWAAICPDPTAVLFGAAAAAAAASSAAAAAAAGAVAAGGAGAAPDADAAAADAGLPPLSLAAPDDDAEAGALLAKRCAAFARVQEYYYAKPMRVERGFRAHLYDTGGRAYIDFVNNVAAAGHSHPRISAAVHAQLRRLNTNSRFHYAAVAELSARLAAIAPPGLDTVLLVNSGSEAVDLALRIAQTVAGRMDILAVKEAYHGVTMLSDAVTTSLWDNPLALETRPPWIHLASAPNSYRGRFRGAEAASGYAEELKSIVAELAAKGTPPAAFIAEPLFGNAGGVELPVGYLAAAYEAVRAHGGLCIADEVQVGYGRTGAHWWAHEAHGVQPDMVTIAKAMGNGHPLGAVLTKRSIVDAFAKTGSFFSSAGGSPVSCTVGLAVLDIIRDEKLQENAKAVGDRLAARCTALAERFPIVGAVHGRGLYMGVELVRDRESREPATKESYAICERMRELGVICQPTGERANVLKMKPPMVLTLADADFFADALEKTLAEGW